MKTDDFDYELPASYIAQSPAIPRDSCKLLTLHRDGRMEHNVFSDIGKFLQAGDLLVVNETRVLPARLFGQKQTGAKVEALLLDKVAGAPDSAYEQTWNCMVRPGKRLKVGAIINYYDNAGEDEYTGSEAECADNKSECTGKEGECVDREVGHLCEAEHVGGETACASVCNSTEYAGSEPMQSSGAATPILQGEIIDIDASNGSRVVRFTIPSQIVQIEQGDAEQAKQGGVEQGDAEQVEQNGAEQAEHSGAAQVSAAHMTVDEAIHKIGHTPLPPYIKNYAGDEELYQTVYAKNENSAAAPTAGLHFTTALIEQLKSAGIRFANVDLEVGLDTFRLVEEDDPKDHAMHTELYSVPEATVKAIEETKKAGNRVIAVGTTSVRSLESAARTGKLTSCSRKATDLFILPGYEFKVVDAIITNFHVPRSTLMMLVSAFSGRENIMNAYECAKSKQYRFFSFGDAMLLL